MKVVLDTNVFVSGVFFTGPSARILQAWRDHRLQLAVSAEILDEYRRVGERFKEMHPIADLTPFLLLVVVNSDVVLVLALPRRLCDDPTDDTFFACAVAADCRIIVSGDKHLHRASGAMA